MSLTDVGAAVEPVFDGWGYPIIAWANGEKLILFQEFGSYQGEWLMVTRNDEEYLIYKDYYGSCSGCDAYQAVEPKTLSQAREFAAGYKSFIEVPRETMRRLAEAGTMSRLFPANVRGSYSEINYDEFVRDASIVVRLEEGSDFTVRDILDCRNQEIKQRALKQFGYERFKDEAGMEAVDAVGDDVLLRKDDIVFAYVKDSSSERRYLLRVPPNMATLQEAVAWTFGLRASEYRPLVET